MSEISEIEIKAMSKEQNYLRGYLDGKTDTLDEIRAEIWDLHYGNEEKGMTDKERADAYNNAIMQAIKIIDKYKAESET